MLEQQQAQLVAGLRELYKRLQNGQGWPGLPLQEAQNGHPLTHDILERLDLLHAPGDASPANYEGFEEDCGRMQQKLLEHGAAYMQRRRSVSSDSEHEHTSSTSSGGSPPTKPLQFKDSFTRNGAPPTPPMHSPFPREPHLNTAVKTSAHQLLSHQPYIRTNSGLDPASLMRPSWGTDSMMDDFTNTEYMSPFDSPMTYDAPAMSFAPYSLSGPTTNPIFAMPDWTDGEQLDFSNYINPSVPS